MSSLNSWTRSAGRWRGGVFTPLSTPFNSWLMFKSSMTTYTLFSSSCISFRQFYAWCSYLINIQRQPYIFVCKDIFSILFTGILKIFDILLLQNPKITHGTMKEKSTRLLCFPVICVHPLPSLLASTDEHVPAFQQRVERQRERGGKDPFTLSLKKAAKKFWAAPSYMFPLQKPNSWTYNLVKRYQTWVSCLH